MEIILHLIIYEGSGTDVFTYYVGLLWFHIQNRNFMHLTHTALEAANAIAHSPTVLSKE